MNPPSPKRPVRVTIFNQPYTVLAENPAEVEALAARVDELMRSYASQGNIDTTKAAVLACLHMADELHTAEKHFTEYKHKVESKSRMFSVLLDRVTQ